jgi:predicted RNase H-like nuclease (RuvC/YqgF family)
VLQGEQVAVVAKGPWLGRDGFVAETAVQFDRVNSMIARLERELEKSRKTISEMAEEANRVRRFEAFEETLKNSRDYKITDLQRGVRDLKTRLDAIEGDRTTFVGLAHKSLPVIDKKLTEFTTLQEQIDKSQRNAQRNATLMYGALAIAIVAVISHLF